MRIEADRGNQDERREVIRESRTPDKHQRDKQNVYA